MRDEVTNIRGFLIKLTSLHLPPTPHPPCTTMGEYDDNLLSLTYRSNLVKVCKQFVQSNNQFFCSTFRWEFGKSNNIREQNAEKDKWRKLEGVSIAQIVFTRQTGRDYRFFFECLAQETSASVFKNLPPYFIRRTTQPGYVGTIVYQESSDCFEYPKKSLLKSSHQKWYLQNFPSQKNPGIENFKPQQNPSIIPTTWNPEYPLGHKNRHQISILHPGFLTWWSSW